MVDAEETLNEKLVRLLVSCCLLTVANLWLPFQELCLELDERAHFRHLKFIRATCRNEKRDKTRRRVSKVTSAAHDLTTSKLMVALCTPRGNASGVAVAPGTKLLSLFALRM